MDIDTLNLIALENQRQAFIEEKAAIRAVANEGISSKRKQEKVNAIKYPTFTPDDSYLVGNIF